MYAWLLAFDAVINLLLGLPLMLAPKTVTAVLGLPPPATGFYPGLLGAVLTGIGVALLIQVSPLVKRVTGLGLEGALCINLFGSAVLLGWLAFGEMQLALLGRTLLWIVFILVLTISGLELGWHLAGKRQDEDRLLRPDPASTEL